MFIGILPQAIGFINLQTDTEFNCTGEECRLLKKQIVRRLALSFSKNQQSLNGALLIAARRLVTDSIHNKGRNAF